MKSPLTPLRNSRLRRAMTTGMLLAATTLISALLSVSQDNVAMLYLLCVVSVCAVTGSFFCGLAAALGSVYLYNLIFLPPRWQVQLIQMDRFLTIVIFLVVSVITGWMTSQLRRRVWREEENARCARLVAEMGQKYLKLQGRQALVRQTQQDLYQLVGAESAVYLIENGRLSEPMCCPENSGEWGDSLTENLPYLQQAAQQRPGSGTTSFCAGAAGWTNALLIAGDRLLGIAAVHTGQRPFSGGAIPYLQTVLNQLSLSIEREELERESEQIQLEVEKEKLRSNLLRGISHDLRTPLTGIAGAANYIAANAQEIEPEELCRMMRGVERDAVWMNNVVTNLLHLTRIQEGALRIKKTPEVVDDVVSDAIERTRNLRQDRTVSVRLPEEVVIVPMDGLLIRQVLCNLLDNAFSHTRPGAKVRLTVEQQGDTVRFAVEDNGGGIPQPVMDHLFESFVDAGTGRADGRRGMGLGLAVCRAIIDAHGGKIWAENNQCGGAGVFFTLPMKIEEGTDEPRNIHTDH